MLSTTLRCNKRSSMALAATGSPVTLAQLAMPRLVVMAVLAFR
jgi:hypothetical protein